MEPFVRFQKKGFKKSARLVKLEASKQNRKNSCEPAPIRQELCRARPRGPPPEGPGGSKGGG